MNDIGLGEATTFYRRQKSAEARYYSSAAESKDAAAEENSLLMRQDDSASHTELNLQLTVHNVKKKPRKPSTKWTVYNAKVNLAALLNDPRPGRRQPDFFTKTWGVGWDYLDLSPSPDIPDIQLEHFKRYRKSVLPRLVKHHANMTSTPNNKVPIDAFPPLYTRAHDKASEDIGKVPSIFHSPSFNLSDIQVFQTVFPWYDIESSKPQSKKLHQEKLSHYLDIIEVQIARQVALKSDAFFHIMSSHEELQSRLGGATSSIAVLRDKMKELNVSLVNEPLKMLVTRRKKQRLQMVTRKLKLMATLHQTQPTVQQLLSSSDYVGALDIISTAQEVLAKELTGIRSFKHLGSQLLELEKAINVIIGNEFNAFITKDLNRPLDDGDEAIDEDKLTAVFMGLLRQQSINFISICREECFATIKAIVKQSVISYVSAADTGTSESTSVADQMRFLNFNKWLLLMEDIFKNLLIIISRVKSLTDIMKMLSLEAAGVSSTEALDEADQEPNGVLPKATDASEGQTIITEMLAHKICRELREMLIKICEHANERASKVINARSKDMFIEKLSSHDFFSLMSSVERFAKSCDQLCTSRISTNSVRGCLQGYSIRFINKFHEERKNKLSLLLDNERWRAGEIPRNLQALVTHCELCEQLTSVPDETIIVEAGPPLYHLLISNQHFVIVGTAVSLLMMILEYCTCVEDLPKSAPDILTKFIELLKLFNSRSAQLVLGAGALQLVGLKTISAKNLALLQRSLEMIIHYLPLIRQQFIVYLAESKAVLLRHLDSVVDEYKQHARVVRDKLREIAAGMIHSCVNQWEIRPPMPSLCFRTLCKQMKKYHEAICDVIEPTQLQQLFRDVNAMLKSKLKDRLMALGITILTGPQQGLIMSDIAYFTENVSTLQSGQTKSTITLSLTLNDIIISK
ncbi:VPS54 [Bugula neritina]|uniref:Vacuolar protein sorting-associated protein 54 n=1 Tax=Bugula neritina TaxID=10212 RepID=A0A7J7JMB8_BUGNE|nr:VPS54 [Bugula neritina]